VVTLAVVMLGLDPADRGDNLLEQVSAFQNDDPEAALGESPQEALAVVGTLKAGVLGHQLEAIGAPAGSRA
jgi:hypothetical protein